MVRPLHNTIDTYMGFGGVHPNENPKAKSWGGILEAPMLLVALWILLDWYLFTQGMIDHEQRRISDWIIWSFFVFETALLTALCSDKLQHLKRNWANIAIILLAFPLFYDTHQEFAVLRMIRLFFLVGYFTHNVRMVKTVLRQNHLGKTLTISVMFITGGGILIAGIDPAIETPGDGIWWAWVTVTTVGYGDIVPESLPGRAFASLLILLGITMVSLITANVSAYLLSRNTEKELRYERRELKKLLELEQRVDRIEKKIDQLIESKK
ncbi:MAG: ion channel [Pseudomonadales bacterium]|nr:ion channel [Pseudomonadales bacterium]